MIKGIALCVGVLLFAGGVSSQSVASNQKLACKMGTTRGNARDAVKAKRHEYTSRAFIAQLGYIDTTFTTFTHFKNNAEVGLVVLPEDKGCEVVSYEFSSLPKRGDLIGPYKMSGNALFGSSNQVRDVLYRMKPGDKFMFDNIKGKCPGKDILFSLKGFTILTVSDSAYKKMLRCCP